jgi:hypothetical protein
VYRVLGSAVMLRATPRNPKRIGIDLDMLGRVILPAKVVDDLHGSVITAIINEHNFIEDVVDGLQAVANLNLLVLSAQHGSSAIALPALIQGEIKILVVLAIAKCGADPEWTRFAKRESAVEEYASHDC